MQKPDILADIEHDLKEAHDATNRELRTLRRRYPLFFLLVLTVSIAAVFHGIDGMLEDLDAENRYPLLIALGGIAGLFLSGVLYKRLGTDKYE